MSEHDLNTVRIVAYASFVIGFLGGIMAMSGW